MDSETGKHGTAGPPALPESIGTPGTTGVVEEGGRLVRAGAANEAGSLETTERLGPLGIETGPQGSGPDQVPEAHGAGERAGREARLGTAAQTLAQHAEELRPRVRRVLAGEVVLRKRVVVETRTLEVELRREELVVERRALGEESPEGAAPGGPPEGTVRELRDGETLTIVLREEEIRVQQVPVVAEEVVVGKRLVEATQPVAATVRREVLRVEREGAATVREAGDATPAG